MLSLTFQASRTPPDRIQDDPLAFQPIPYIPHGQAVSASTIFGEEILEFLRQKTPFAVVCARIGSMLGFVDLVEVDAEQRVRNETGTGRIGEERVDDEDGEDADQDVEADGVETVVGVARPDDAVAIAVKEIAMLLQDCLMRMSPGPIEVFGTLGVGRRGRSIGACGA